jgi:hypothetical protein
VPNSGSNFITYNGTYIIINATNTSYAGNYSLNFTVTAFNGVSTSTIFTVQALALVTTPNTPNTPTNSTNITSKINATNEPPQFLKPIPD